jgi:hypothetical protein
VVPHNVVEYYGRFPTKGCAGIPQTALVATLDTYDFTQCSNGIFKILPLHYISILPKKTPFTKNRREIVTIQKKM